MIRQVSCPSASSFVFGSCADHSGNQHGYRKAPTNTSNTPTFTSILDRDLALCRNLVDLIPPRRHQRP
jgi:hypothetical protein